MVAALGQGGHDGLAGRAAGAGEGSCLVSRVVWWWIGWRVK